MSEYVSSKLPLMRPPALERESGAWLTCAESTPFASILKTPPQLIYYDKPIVKYEYTGHYNTHSPSLRID